MLLSAAWGPKGADAINPLILRFHKNGQPCPVTDLSDRGIAFAGEELVQPRQLSLQYGWPSDSSTPGKIAEFRIDTYQQRHGLDWNDLDLELTNVGGELHVNGRRGPLPECQYWFRIRVEDAKIARPHRRFQLAAGQATVRDLEISDDVPSIRLQRTPSAFAAPIRRLVQHPDSTADGMPLAAWICSDRPRANRRACLLNLLAKLRSIRTPRGPFLIEHVRHVYVVDSDRVHARVDRAFLTALRELAATEARRFYPETRTHAPVHDLLGVKRPPRPPSSPYPPCVLRDFREVASPSLQCVVAVPVERRPRDAASYDRGLEIPGGAHFADLDLDLGVVRMDLLGALTHFAEILMPGRTDHVALASRLAADPAVEPFLYYRPA